MKAAVTGATMVPRPPIWLQARMPAKRSLNGRSITILGPQNSAAARFELHMAGPHVFFCVLSQENHLDRGVHHPNPIAVEECTVLEKGHLDGESV